MRWNVFVIYPKSYSFIKLIVGEFIPIIYWVIIVENAIEKQTKMSKINLFVITNELAQITNNEIIFIVIVNLP